MRSLNRPNAPAPESICVACGLCCDGTIFSDVKLVRGDDAKVLASLGLPLTHRQPTNQKAAPTAPRGYRFPQPCRALEGCRCRIYESRPGYCRQFECLLLKQVQQNRATPAQALRLIRAARRRAHKVRQLLRALGDADEQNALADRFRRTTRRLQNGTSDRETAELYGRLTLAFHNLLLLIRASFYNESSDEQRHQS